MQKSEKKALRNYHLRLFQNFSFGTATFKNRSFVGRRPKNCMRLFQNNRFWNNLIFLMPAVYGYADQVDATHEGIAGASSGDYIIRPSGEKIVLKQADIDYAKKRLGRQAAQSSQAEPKNPARFFQKPSAFPSTPLAGAAILFALIMIFEAVPKLQFLERLPLKTAVL